MKLRKKILLYLIILFLFSILLDLKFVLFFIFVTYINAKFSQFQFKFAWIFRIEIATFGVILISYTHNFLLGAATGITSVMLNSIYLKWFRREDIYISVLYIIISVLSSYMALNIRLLGILISIFYFLAMLFLRTFVLSQAPQYRFGRSISNLVFNLILFSFGTGEFFLFFLS